MIGIEVPMPKTCGDCPCNDDNYRCGVTGEELEYQWTRRAGDCPLIDLTDDGK